MTPFSLYPDGYKPSYLFERPLSPDLRAAMVFQCWMTRRNVARPGLELALADALNHTHAASPERKHLLFQIGGRGRGADLLVFLLLDRSGLVARRQGERLQVLPTLFRLPSWSCCTRPHLLALRQVVPAQNAGRLQIGTNRSHRDSPDALFDSGDPALDDLDTPLGQAVAALRRDLCALEPAFDRMPQIADSFLESGAGRFFPRFLPHEGFDTQDKARLTEWFRDLADWYRLQIAARGIDDPDLRAELRLLPDPKGKVRFDIRLGDRFLDDPDSLFASGNCHLPRAQRGYFGFALADLTRIQHRIVSPLKISCTPGPTSAHRRLRLRARFGPMA